MIERAGWEGVLEPLAGVGVSGMQLGGFKYMVLRSLTRVQNCL